MPQLASIIEKAANAFALSIIDAVKGATLQELLAMQGAATPGRKRGRPPKTAVTVTAKKAGRKPAKPAAKKVAKAATKKKAKINWPKCAVPGCGKNRYSRGNGMCGAHFKAAQAGATA